MDYKAHSTCVVDFETYYDDQYSLKKMQTTDYIRDPRFKVHCVAIKYADQPAKVYPGGKEASDALHAIDWSKTYLCAQNCHFEGLILSEHFGIFPLAYIDTVSMSRMLFGVDVFHNLDAICERLLGRKSKFRGKALDDVKGTRDLTPEQFQRLAEYNLDDANDTMAIAEKMLPVIPPDELELINMTVTMYAVPMVYIDYRLMKQVEKTEAERKQKLLDAVAINPAILSSNNKFAEFLESLGVDVPMKVSPRTGLVTPALAKNDLAFKELLAHPDETVRTVIEARMAIKSTGMQTRAAALAQRGRDIKPCPIHLNYWGARTGRWSGGDGVNFQNFPRKSKIREAIMAPRDLVLVVADQSQIEARLNAWKAGQDDVVDAFANGRDVYCLTATNIYGFEVDPELHPDERFVGKTFVLGAGYGAGATKLHYMLRIGQFGPPVDITLDEVKRIVSVWRTTNIHIVNAWQRHELYLRDAFLGERLVEDGCIAFEGSKGRGFIHMPNGSYIRYENVRFDPETKNVIYDSRQGVRKLYGGLITENIIQALARRVMAEQMLQASKMIPDFYIVTTTHDEIIAVTRADRAQEASDHLLKIMSTTPEWAEGLPLSAKISYAERYIKN